MKTTPECRMNFWLAPLDEWTNAWEGLEVMGAISGEGQEVEVQEGAGK